MNECEKPGSKTSPGDRICAHCRFHEPSRVIDRETGKEIDCSGGLPEFGMRVLGQCRISHPLTIGGWPRVEDGDWCGEYEGPESERQSEEPRVSTKGNTQIEAWRFDTPKDTPCPICKEKGKCVERSDDYELRTKNGNVMRLFAVEVLRCRYCKHDFEALRSTFIPANE
jgi:hypothetical protein